MCKSHLEIKKLRKLIILKKQLGRLRNLHFI